MSELEQDRLDVAARKRVDIVTAQTNTHRGMIFPATHRQPNIVPACVTILTVP